MHAPRFYYGGQAVIEGVMMRGMRQATVAVRSPKGELVFRTEQLHPRRRVWERLPFLRGVLMLWDALSIGMRALSFSSRVAVAQEGEPPPSRAAMALTLALSLAFAIGLFFVLPLLIAQVIAAAGASPLVRTAIEGVLQLAIFIGYLALIGRMPEIQRVFGYHGAEHKTINAYEAGAPLTVDAVRPFTLIHPRCGTSFLLVVIVISIPIFTLFGGLPFAVRLLARLALIPLIAAVSYELLRLAAAHYGRAWVRALVAPSLALQKLTTREPDDQMIEVAIAALRPVLAADGVVFATDERAIAVGEPLSA